MILIDSELISYLVHKIFIYIIFQEKNKNVYKTYYLSKYRIISV